MLRMSCVRRMSFIPKEHSHAPLKSHFPENALPTLETVLKQTQEARVFRRAQAVREVVAGHHVNTVSTSHRLRGTAPSYAGPDPGAHACDPR